MAILILFIGMLAFLLIFIPLIRYLVKRQFECQKIRLEAWQHYYVTHRHYSAANSKSLPILEVLTLDKSQRSSWIRGYREARQYWENDLLRRV